MMHRAMINGSSYNLNDFPIIQWDDNKLKFYTVVTLEIDGEPAVDLVTYETGPEAAAAWEWLQKACIWKMDKTPGSAK